MQTPAVDAAAPWDTDTLAPGPWFGFALSPWAPVTPASNWSEENLPSTDEADAFGVACWSAASTSESHVSSLEYWRSAVSSVVESSDVLNTAESQSKNEAGVTSKYVSSLPLPQRMSASWYDEAVDIDGVPQQTVELLDAAESQSHRSEVQRTSENVSSLLTPQRMSASWYDEVVDIDEVSQQTVEVADAVESQSHRSEAQRTSAGVSSLPLPQRMLASRYDEAVDIDGVPQKTVEVVDEGKLTQTAKVVDKGKLTHIVEVVVDKGQLTQTVEVVDDRQPTQTVKVVDEGKLTNIVEVVVAKGKLTQTVEVVDMRKPTQIVEVVDKGQPTQTIEVVGEGQPTQTLEVVDEGQPTQTLDVVDEEQPTQTLESSAAHAHLVDTTSSTPKRESHWWQSFRPEMTRNGEVADKGDDDDVRHFKKNKSADVVYNSVADNGPKFSLFCRREFQNSERPEVDDLYTVGVSHWADPSTSESDLSSSEDWCSATSSAVRSSESGVFHSADSQSENEAGVTPEDASSLPPPQSMSASRQGEFADTDEVPLQTVEVPDDREPVETVENGAARYLYRVDTAASLPTRKKRWLQKFWPSRMSRQTEMADQGAAGDIRHSKNNRTDVTDVCSWR